MAVPVEAKAICDPSSLNDLITLAEINQQIKDLEAKKQVMVAKVKQFMSSKHLTSLSMNGNIFTLVESQRKNVTKSTKDEFVSELISHGFRYLIKASIEPDVDGVLAEVDAGNLTQEFVDKYVKITPVVTLRVT